jgi:multiple sugar transport system substrate-binding protein
MVPHTGELRIFELIRFQSTFRIPESKIYLFALPLSSDYFSAMQTWSKKLLVSVVILAVVTLVFYLVFLMSKPESKKDYTKVFFADNISSAHTKLIQKFNREYKNNIEVVPINLPFSKFTTNERKELLARALRSKSDRIDVFAVDLIWVPRFARWAEPLDLYFPSRERDNILEYALQSCYSNGNLVAMPLYIDVGLIYYRKDILQSLRGYEQIKTKVENSLTWEEFIDISLRLKKKYQYTYLFAADNYEGLVCNYLELVYGHEGSIFEADTIQLKSQQSIKALNLMIDMIHKYQIVPDKVTSFDEYQCYLYALENDVPFFKGWPGLKQQYYGKIPHSEKMKDILIGPLPHFKNFKSKSVFGGWNLMVPKDSNKKRAAVEFIKFVLKPENQLILYEKSGFLPVSKTVYTEGINPEINSDLKFYRELLDKGFHRPFLQNYTKISDILSYYVNRALKKELSASEALEQATRLINSNKVLIK